MRPNTVLMSGLMIGGTLLTQELFAAEWQRSAGLSLSTYYSDNICLSHDDHIGRGAVTATPTVSLRGQGARANMLLDAALRYDSLADSNLSCTSGQIVGRPTNRESLIPSLRYAGNLELVENWLTLESDAFVARNPIDPFAPGGSRDRFDGRDNINITYQYGAGATVQRRLFDSADMRLHYYHNEQHNGVNLLGDSSEDRGEFELSTNRGNNRLTVGVAGVYSEVTYEGNERRPTFDNTLSSAEARAGLQVSSSWQINGMVGEEWNEFTSLRPDIDGSYWQAGLRWSPNDRVEVNVGTGERFFGTTPYVSIRYRHRRSELTADYSRTLTIPRNLRAPDMDFEDPFDPDFGQLPGEPPSVSGEPTFIGNSPIINERLNVRYRFSARRTSVTISASDSRQTRLEDLSEGKFINAGLTLSRDLSSNLSGNLRLNWGEREGEGNNVGPFGQNSQIWRAGLGFNRRVGSDTTISVVYEYTSRESAAVINEYDENRVTLSARHQF